MKTAAQNALWIDLDKANITGNVPKNLARKVFGPLAVLFTWIECFDARNSRELIEA